jgi:DNA-binding transcriptional regulator YdaS (Cro superfamily)
MPDSRIPRAVALAAMLAVQTPALAQNGMSFSEAAAMAADLSARVGEAAITCRDLRTFGDFDVAIVTARHIAAADGVPAHCRVDGVIRPQIGFQVNLPTNWNGRFYMHGNRGYAGARPDAGRAAADRDAALAHAFATAFTDTGHDSAVEALASFAFNDPGQEIDYAFRAVHLTAEIAKRLIRTYYGRPHDYAYWDGCSTGGREGLMSAQRFPEDFDGIVAGSPILNFADMQIAGVWNELSLSAAEPRLAIAQLDTIAAVVYARCDALDGLRDGLIDDPRRCPFDPLADLPDCAGEPQADCFTGSQKEALARVYGGVTSNGKPYFPGQPVGAEAKGVANFDETTIASGWAVWLISPSGGPSVQGIFGRSFLENLAFDVDRADYDWTGFDFDRDPQRMARIRGILDATDPDLSAFAQAGGRMISYFGWADTALNPMMMSDYYEKVAATVDRDVREFYRLFMAPGMFHCRGGLGPDRFDAMRYLVNWVEHGVAPDRIVATQMRDGRVVRSRPLCPYPELARYDGKGDANSASAFGCVTP